MKDHINLVNKTGKRIGHIDKLEAHVKGKLHEAFSIFVFNNNHELLLQRRALHKYHSGGLWTNTCCSHPRVNEQLESAVHRRLKEEMGFDCTLEKRQSFIYKAEGLANNLIEHELDYVFVGYIEETTKIIPNKDEVCEYKWMKQSELEKDIKRSPEKYTEWLKIIVRDNFFRNAR